MTTTHPQTRTAAAVLKASQKVVAPAIHAATEQFPPALHRMISYHFGWTTADGTPSNTTGGKALRPALALLSAEAMGRTNERAVQAAAAVELVHNFSLIHDDVMDGDRLRRNRETVWAVFGVPESILAGDALLAAAFQCLSVDAARPNNDMLPELCAAVIELCAGQHADLTYQSQNMVGSPQCTEMAMHKTGALFGCACALGALATGAAATQVDHMREFGRHLGLAYQYVDDILGIWGNSPVTGKPVGSDLANRKKSLPVVAALESGTPAGRELAEFYNTTLEVGSSRVERAAELVELAGGLSWAHGECAKELRTADRHLVAARGHPRATSELDVLARFVTDRCY